jgi:hypothetical protein
MPIDLKELINKVTAEAQAPAVEKTAEATPAPAPVQQTDDEMKKVAAEMDEAGRVMARAFYDELNKLAVSAHGVVESVADHVKENPAVQVSTKPERMENANKALAIIQQLTNGERLQGPEGYIAVNGNIVSPAAPEFVPSPANETAVAYDATKQGNAEVITKLYERFFAEGK